MEYTRIGNQDKGINIKSLSSFVNLECLKISGLNLTDMSFQGLFRLERLELNCCDFTNFKSESFRYAPNLEGIVIKNPKPNDKAKNFYFNLKELSKLKYLHLHGFYNFSQHLSSLLKMIILKFSNLL